jgi:hypothetical protein
VSCNGDQSSSSSFRATLRTTCILRRSSTTRIGKYFISSRLLHNGMSPLCLTRIATPSFHLPSLLIYALPLHPPVTYLPAPAGSSLSVVNPRGIVTSDSSRAQPPTEDPNQNPNSASKSLLSELHPAPANLVAFSQPPIPSSFARLAPFLWLISVAFVARMVSSRPLPLRFAAVLLEAFFTQPSQLPFG